MSGSRVSPVLVSLLTTISTSEGSIASMADDASAVGWAGAYGPVISGAVASVSFLKATEEEEEEEEGEEMAQSYPCRPTHRYMGEDGYMRYNVELLYHDKNDEDCTEDVDGIMFGMPPQIFLFREKLYTRDQAQPWSFRHDMRIPDELVSSAWINNATLETECGVV
mmetsp:Transcript_10290/g.13601  ORF Transcript_10290/g.13601 Transcript_10290/m.13601 type:complete len:166 (+) Transcript_10290:1510-2007(+)